jgi:hypothetical protein
VIFFEIFLAYYNQGLPVAFVTAEKAYMPFLPDVFSLRIRSCGKIRCFEGIPDGPGQADEMPSVSPRRLRSGLKQDKNTA